MASKSNVFFTGVYFWPIRPLAMPRLMSVAPEGRSGRSAFPMAASLPRRSLQCQQRAVGQFDQIAQPIANGFADAGMNGLGDVGVFLKGRDGVAVNGESMQSDHGASDIGETGPSAVSASSLAVHISLPSVPRMSDSNPRLNVRGEYRRQIDRLQKFAAAGERIFVNLAPTWDRPRR